MRDNAFNETPHSRRRCIRTTDRLLTHQARPIARAGHTFWRYPHSWRSHGTHPGRTVTENPGQSTGSARHCIALPAANGQRTSQGKLLDGSRYVVGGDTQYCEDEPSGPNAPVRFSDWRDIKTPPGIDFNALVAQVGDLWKSWGWQVIERNGYDKPNRFGYAPDGYVLQITASYPPTYPPSIIGASPCYPGNLRRNDIQRNPPVITQTQSSG